jgi:glyoxylase-like metal-dependent hydrolase (beta-lactamase superfamily II)
MWPQQSVQEVADGIFAVVHGKGEVGVANASFILEENSAFLVDSMTFPEMAANMAQEITRRGARVEVILNTHHHIDHMGGNQFFANARLLAHPKSIAAVRKMGMPVEHYNRIMPHFRGRFADLELAIPEPIPDQLVLPRKGELLIFSPGHTIADVSVWFSEERVLLAGDLCFIGVTPLAVNGFISGWIEALDALIALEPAVVVPGHGPIGTLRDLIVLRSYFAAVSQMGYYAAKHKMSLQDALASFDAGPVAEWIETERNAINLERAMQEANGEISRSDLSAIPPSLRKS